MIYCPTCGTNNRHGSKFCNECGTKLVDPSQVRCPACGEANPAGATACDACAQELPAPVAPIPFDSGDTGPGEETAGSSAGTTDLPLWFRSLPPETTEEIRESADAGEMVEGPAIAAISPELDGEAATGEGDEPEAGIEEALLAASTIAQPRAAIAAPLSQSEEGLQDARPMTAQAQLFAEIVAIPAHAPPEDAAQPGAPWLSSRPRWILFALLIAAITIPLLVGRPLLLLAQEWLLPGSHAGTDSLAATPAVAALYDQIASLERDAPVLVAVDYDPTAMEEMNPLAQAILQHLLEEQARVVTVSLLPAGAGTAQELLDAVDAGGDGQRYANLGYLAGQAAGIRLLGQSVSLALPTDFRGNQVSGLEVMEGITSLQDFDLIVELAASPDTLRWWVEQGSTPHKVPLVAGVSAAVEPLAQPRLETEPRQVRGMAGGIRGAAMYEALLSDRMQGGDLHPAGGGAGAGRLAAQRLGLLVLIVAFLVSAAFYVARREAEQVR